MNASQSAHEDEALLALRRTLWQLAVVGLATGIATTRLAPDAAAVAAWCVLVPLCALLVHFRHELLERWATRARVDGQRARPRRGVRRNGGGRRRSAMAVRPARSPRVAAVR